MGLPCIFAKAFDYTIRKISSMKRGHLFGMDYLSAYHTLTWNSKLFFYLFGLLAPFTVKKESSQVSIKKTVAFGQRYGQDQGSP